MQVIRVRVKPNSKKEELFFNKTINEWVAFVKQPAVNGKANKALLKLLRKRFLNPIIKKGFSNKEKLVAIDGVKSVKI